MTERKTLSSLIGALEHAAAELLAAAPLSNDAGTRALANKPGVYFATTITPHAASIELIAGAERVEVFRYSSDAPSTFDMSDAP